MSLSPPGPDTVTMSFHTSVENSRRCVAIQVNVAKDIIVLPPGVTLELLDLACLKLPLLGSMVSFPSTNENTPATSSHRYLRQSRRLGL